MKFCPTYNAQIYVGLRHGYTGLITSFEFVESFIQKWADELGACVSVTRTKFVYTKGNEPGIIVGFINYPRFPLEPKELESRVMELAQKLLIFCQQMNVSIVFPKNTLMISNQEEIDNYEKSKKLEESRIYCQCVSNPDCSTRQYVCGSYVYCEKCNRALKS
jgi:hypothetical protein